MHEVLTKYSLRLFLHILFYHKQHNIIGQFFSRLGLKFYYIYILYKLCICKY